MKEQLSGRLHVLLQGSSIHNDHETGSRGTLTAPAFDPSGLRSRTGSVRPPRRVGLGTGPPQVARTRLLTSADIRGVRGPISNPVTALGIYGLLRPVQRGTSPSPTFGCEDDRGGCEPHSPEVRRASNSPPAAEPRRRRAGALRRPTKHGHRERPRNRVPSHPERPPRTVVISSDPTAGDRHGGCPKPLLRPREPFRRGAAHPVRRVTQFSASR